MRGVSVVLSEYFSTVRTLGTYLKEKGSGRVGRSAAVPGCCRMKVDCNFLSVGGKDRWIIPRRRGVRPTGGPSRAVPGRTGSMAARPYPGSGQEDWLPPLYPSALSGASPSSPRQPRHPPDTRLTLPSPSFKGNPCILVPSSNRAQHAPCHGSGPARPRPMLLPNAKPR